MTVRRKAPTAYNLPMVTEIAIFTVREGHQKDFEASVAKAQKYFAAVDYCHEWKLIHCIEQPDRYMLQVRWTDMESHTKTFRGSPEYADFRATMGAFTSGPADVQHYDDVPLPPA